MLMYGCTRLEIGVQSVYEDVARDSNRGHTVRAVMESFQLAKDCGFKVDTTPLGVGCVTPPLTFALGSVTYDARSSQYGHGERLHWVH